MKQIAALRVTQATAKYGEHAPLATACCNACRTCVQTNLLGLAIGAFAAAGVAAKRLFAGRSGGPSAPGPGPTPLQNP